MAWPKGVPRTKREDVVDDIDVVAEIELPEESTPSVAAAPAISPDMMALISAMQAQNLLNLAEMKKPSEAEQKKLDEDAARRVAIARNAAFAAMEGEKQQKALQANCTHSKPNGFTAFVAQVNSNGCYRAFCPYCHYTSPPIRVQDWQKAEGLNMHKMKNITIAQLEAAAAASLPPLTPQAVPFGFVPEAL